MQLSNSYIINLLKYLNFALFSEYVKTNVRAKPVTLLHEMNHCCTVISHTCSCETLIVSIQYTG